MQLELFSYIEGDNVAELGEYKGKITLEEDDIVMDLNDDDLAEEMEQLFSEPLLGANGILNENDETEPYTPEFFRAVIPLLPDYGVRGILKDDEEERGYFSSIPAEAEAVEEEEELEQDSEEMAMGMMSIEDIDDEELESQSIEDEEYDGESEEEEEEEEEDY